MGDAFFGYLVLNEVKEIDVESSSFVLILDPLVGENLSVLMFLCDVADQAILWSFMYMLLKWVKVHLRLNSLSSFHLLSGWAASKARVLFLCILFFFGLRQLVCIISSSGVFNALICTYKK